MEATERLSNFSNVAQLVKGRVSPVQNLWSFTTLCVLLPLNNTVV